MKISAAVSMWLCAVFALVTCGVAFYAFSQVAGLSNQEDRDMARGYALFWGFLGAVGAACGVVSWMIKEGKLGQAE
jgi:hypothetical protein